MARKIVAYEAEDGSTFRTQAEADAHDETLKQEQAIGLIAQELQEVSPDLDVAAVEQYLRENGARLAEIFGDKAKKRTRRTKAELEAEKALAAGETGHPSHTSPPLNEVNTQDGATPAQAGEPEDGGAASQNYGYS